MNDTVRSSIKIIFILFIFLSIFSCNFEKKKNYKTVEQEEEIVKFLIYGELLPDGYIDPYIDNNTDSITKKFGFVVRRISGCDVTNALINDAEETNKASNKKMKRKYGVNWKDKFEKQTKYKLYIPEIDDE